MIVDCSNCERNKGCPEGVVIFSREVERSEEFGEGRGCNDKSFHEMDAEGRGRILEEGSLTDEGVEGI